MGLARVLVIEPNPHRRQEIATVLNRNKKIKVVGTRERLEESLGDGLTGRDLPNVVVINIDHPSMNSVRNWALLRSSLPGVSIVALTKCEDEELLEFAIAAGFIAIQTDDTPAINLCNIVVDACKGVLNYNPFVYEKYRQLLSREEIDVNFHFGGLVIDKNANKVTRWGELINLSQLEFSFLVCLAEHFPEPVNIPDLLKVVWNTTLDEGGTVDQVKSCVKRIRKKIEPNPRIPRYILSMTGVGYLIADPFNQMNSM